MTGSSNSLNSVAEASCSLPHAIMEDATNHVLGTTYDIL